MSGRVHLRQKGATLSIRADDLTRKDVDRLIPALCRFVANGDVAALGPAPRKALPRKPRLRSVP